MLIRLRKGQRLLNEAIQAGDITKANMIIRHWQSLSDKAFIELEKGTLILQHMLTGNSVLIKADGTLIGNEKIMNTEPIELDPWLLLSLQTLKEVYGEDIHNFITIKEGKIS